MQPDWDYVKRTTLWHYEPLIKKLLLIRAYPVLWQAYNQDMTRAAAFARSLFPHANIEEGDYPAAVIATLELLRDAGVQNWQELLDEVAAPAGCVRFLQERQIEFEPFIDVLRYLLRWGFPFTTASRQLMDHHDEPEMAHYEALKGHKIMNSFDLLQQGYTAAGRAELATLTGVPAAWVVTIVHRADIARLPFVRRKTILAVCGAGYDTLSKIAGASLAEMEDDMDAYYRRTQGKSWQAFKSVILLRELIAGAIVLPLIVEP